MRHNRLRCILLLAIITLCLPLTACTPPAPTGESVTITFACMDYTRSQYEDLVKDFEKANRDIRVQFVSADEVLGMQRQGNTGVYPDAPFEGLAAAADTFVWFARLRPADWSYLLDLQPFVDDSSSSFPADDFYPGTLDDFRWQGSLYGLPAQVVPILIFYDKGMFDETGVAYPEIGWTWDDFRQAADQLTEREGDEVSCYGFVDAWPHNTIFAMMHQRGVSLWDDSTDPPRPLFDRPEVADVLRRYMHLALTYGVMPVPEIGSNVMASTLVNEGKAAMWTAFAYDYDYHAHRIDLGLAPFPEDVAAANPRTMDGFFASAGTTHPKAAWRWLTYLSDHYQPMEGNLPGRRSVGERMPWWRRPDRDARAAVEYALAHPLPKNPLNRPLLGAINTMIEGQAGVEEALATAQSKALALQAELAVATPAASQPVSPPQPTPSDVETTITFAPASGGDPSLYRALAITFNESHPDTRVEVIPPSLNPAELATASDCFAGRLPVHYPEVRQLIRSLQPLLETDVDFELADFYPQFLETLRHDGELWGIPYQADALMVYYHRDRFTETGTPLPGPPALSGVEGGWSVDDFLSTAVAMSNGSQYGFTTREGAYGDLVFVLERLGARLVDDSTGDRPPVPTFDDPTVIAALGRYADLSRQHSLSPATPSIQSGWPDATIWGGHPARVESGQVAMWIDYIGNQVVAPPLSFETGVAPLPLGTQASTELNVSAYYISAHTPAPWACWEWLAFLSSQPEVVQLLPARRSVAASASWQSQVDETALPAYQATLEYNDTSIFRLRWEIPWLAYAYPWLDEAFQAAMAGDDAEQALTEAQRKAEAYVLCLEREDGFANVDVLRTCAREVDPDYRAFGE